MSWTSSKLEVFAQRMEKAVTGRAKGFFNHTSDLRPVSRIQRLCKTQYSQNNPTGKRANDLKEHGADGHGEARGEDAGKAPGGGGGSHRSPVGRGNGQQGRQAPAGTRRNGVSMRRSGGGCSHGGNVNVNTPRLSSSAPGVHPRADPALSVSLSPTAGHGTATHAVA